MKKIYEMTRGDTFAFEVEVKVNGVIVPVDGMYLTVKNNTYLEEPIIQKKLGGGVTLGNDAYYIVINPEDTDTLEYGRYKYDIEFIVDGFKRTIEKGILSITDEVTFSCNEV